MNGNLQFEIRHFRIEVSPESVNDLQDRLARTRWPEPLPGARWQRGVPVSYRRDLADYWMHQYDWPKHQSRLNELPQFTTVIGEQTIDFLHVRSAEPNATPLLLIHGWPGSFVEFVELIGSFTDPPSHDGDAVDAFDEVIPSAPGHGFLAPLSGRGWTHGRCVPPTAVAVSLTQDVAIRRFAERDHNIVRWTESDRGGDFIILEAPESLIRDGAFFRSLH